MIYRTAADAVLVAHLLFVSFVVLGGLLSLKWPRAAWIHLPAAAWGAIVEFMGWVCPLTPLEGQLRSIAGEEGIAGGFIEHYLLPIIYPHELTRWGQVGLGALVVVLNLIVYGAVLRRRLAERAGR